MKRRAASCIEIEADIVAAAIGEADALVEGRVAAHVAKCEPCRVEHTGYRAIDRELGTIRDTAVDVRGVVRSRERLHPAAEPRLRRIEVRARWRPADAPSFLGLQPRRRTCRRRGHCPWPHPLELPLESPLRLL